MAIYVNFNKPRTIKQFIKKFYKLNDYPINPVNTAIFNRTGCVQTFRDEGCTIIQCPPDKLRSFDSFLEIVQTYYPSCTPKILFLRLIQVHNNSERYMMNLVFCAKVNKITFCWYTSQNASGKKNNITRDSVHLMYLSIRGEGNYTWKELFNLVNL
jgi:hypothetical protein